MRQVNAFGLLALLMGLVLRGSVCAEDSSSGEGGGGKAFRGGAGGEGGKGGAGGGSGGAGGDGQVIQAPDVSAEQLKAAEEAMTPDQRKQFEELIRLQCIEIPKKEGKSFKELQQEAAKGGIAFSSETELIALIRKQYLTWIASESPEKQQQHWTVELPQNIKRLRKQLDPLYLDEGEKAAAEKVGKEAAEAVKTLLSDDVESYLTARRKILELGAGCKVLLAERARALPPGSAKRIRVESLLASIDSAEQGSQERLLRVADEALRKLDDLRAKRGVGQSSRLAILISRRLMGGRETPFYDKMCYFSFIKEVNDYGRIPVSLEFGNGSGSIFTIRMYGGQENRIKDFGAVDFGSVKSAPNMATTTEWEEGLRGHGLAATAGHVYVEHCMEPREKVNRTFKFKVLELHPEEYVVIEYDEIPQEK